MSLTWALRLMPWVLRSSAPSCRCPSNQVDDAYSHLALQAIEALGDRYDVEFRFHLVDPTDRLHAPEPELLADYARRHLDLKTNALRASTIERDELCLRHILAYFGDVPLSPPCLGGKAEEDQ